ncbi:hypothetical protein MRX96_025865 [Rhipicephalus microplus]
MATSTELPARENCFLFTAPQGNVSIDNLIDAIEFTTGDDSVYVLQHMGGAKFLLCTRNANQATKLMVEEGFRVNDQHVPVEAVGPPVTFVNVYRDGAGRDSGARASSRDTGREPRSRSRRRQGDEPQRYSREGSPTREARQQRTGLQVSSSDSDAAPRAKTPRLGKNAVTKGDAPADGGETIE